MKIEMHDQFVQDDVVYWREYLIDGGWWSVRLDRTGCAHVKRHDGQLESLDYDYLHVCDLPAFILMLQELALLHKEILA